MKKKRVFDRQSASYMRMRTPFPTNRSMSRRGGGEIQDGEGVLLSREEEEGGAKEALRNSREVQVKIEDIEQIVKNKN